MTTFGKILVFVNLVFSLLVCALIILVFIARTNWKEAYEAKNRQYDAARASADASQEQLKATILQSEKDVDSARATEKKASEDADDYRKKLAAADKDRQKLNEEKTKLEAAVDRMKIEVAQRAEEVKKQEEFLANTTQRLSDLIKEFNKEKDLRVNAEIKQKSMGLHAQMMEARLEELTKDNIRLKQGGGSLASKPATSNPPPQNVEGLIKNTDTSGLVTLTIGSDSGIEAGHTLEVFRLEPRPLYLGTIRILKSTPTEAVGQPLRPPHAPLQMGDRVAGKIGAGG